MSYFSFAIDRGGTFTDLVCIDENGTISTLKLLSEDPNNYKDAPTEGIRRLLEKATGKSLPRHELVPTTQISSIRMGTTVATNALLERRGKPTVLIVTKGFKDILHIGNQSRPRIFDLEIAMPKPLYCGVIEVDERLVVMQPEKDMLIEHSSCKVVECTTGEKIIIEKELDLDILRSSLRSIREETGATSAAIALLHSYAYGAHENAVGKIALEVGFTQISLSHKVMPAVKLVPRGHTACADAYLSPVLRSYVDGFASGFEKGLKNDGTSPSPTLLFMQSDGGLTDSASFSGHRAILSGPAGGCVGFARTTWDALGSSRPVCAFDMGGTSTDVSRFDGSFEHVHESTTAGVTINAPQLDINTVAAGGGSRLFFRAGLYVVGPESAGAHPGPICYRKGGYLAVTDANVQLGRIVPEFFPSIFGPNENEPLDAISASIAFEKLAIEIGKHVGKVPSADEVAAGFIAVANEAMCRPIRALTQMKGHDLSTHVLACFGGAGPQHACAMARALGVETVFVSRFAGVLSAYGLLLADVVSDIRSPCAEHLAKAPIGSEDPGECNPDVAKALAIRLCHLAAEASKQLIAQGATHNQISFSLYVHARYLGTDSGLMVLVGDSDSYEFTYNDIFNISSIDAENNITKHLLNTPRAFSAAYRKEFGFVLRGREVLGEDVRVRAVARHSISRSPMTRVSIQTPIEPVSLPPVSIGTRSVYFDTLGRINTSVFMLESLLLGQRISGPALILSSTTTVVIDPGFTAIVLDFGDLVINDDTKTIKIKSDKNFQNSLKAAVEKEEENVVEVHCDPVRLSVFSHRFMGIAEQMGRTLQRTAVSVNMRERLDYSCALFGVDGGLVANAPHIPVHLGAMQDAVRFQLAYWKDNIYDGDVFVSNHPQLAGGSHLPDITVITPVFIGQGNTSKIAFFVASRGHHADIGGSVPGSMPPLSKSLAEEGAAIIAFKLCSEGIFNETGITEILSNAGSRNLSDCLSDLRAQVAANTRGIALVRELITETIGGLTTVHAYMRFIQKAAEEAVRNMLVTVYNTKELQNSKGVLNAEDFMDDGSKIALAITIDPVKRSAIFDFKGTGAEVFGNTNAPRAVTFSAIIYVLRCLVKEDIPLNQGCLAPIDVCIPEGCLLSPSPTAAVVGGNVLTSQRVVDVILKAFGACAASQGDMNNTTFGDSTFGFYETVCGGAGAGPSWHGRSGVHTHMTNTRVTDPEILERRYPVILRQFSLRKGSGGRGKFNGGDGVIRELQFRRANLLVSVLSERRSLEPYGLFGGANGSRGQNLLKRSSQHISSGPFATSSHINLGGKASLLINKGDTLLVLSPAGGGYGSLTDKKEDVKEKNEFNPIATGSLHSMQETQRDF
jgi:5-oxoprolinase (ATP-hydrolysing)